MIIVKGIILNIKNLINSVYVELNLCATARYFYQTLTPTSKIINTFDFSRCLQAVPLRRGLQVRNK